MICSKYTLIQASLLGLLTRLMLMILQKIQYTTGIIFNFMGGAIVYKSKTQSIIDGSSNEAEFIADNSAAKLACYL